MATKKSKDKNIAGQSINFRITEIKELEFHVIDHKRFGIVELDKNFIKLNFGHTASVEQDKNNITLVFIVDFKYIADGYPELNLINYVISMSFYINEFDNAIKNIEGKSFEVRDEILIQFLSILISTARGTLAGCLSKTHYSDLILPLLPLDKVQEMVVKYKELNP